MRIPGTLTTAALRVLLRTPASVQRLLAGAPVRCEGRHQLDLQVQLMLKLLALSSGPPLASLSVDAARSQVAYETGLLAGAPIAGARVEALRIPRGQDASIPARLYVPSTSGGPGPLLLYFHGGGYVVGDLDTHDNVCRFVASRAGVLVLAVDYRLAPEHPFPAAVEDALVAYRFAVEQARALGAKRSAIAVGGDSAGGSLATVICQRAIAEGVRAPAFQWLLYPIADFAQQRPSYRLFGEGFGLTAAEMEWFRSLYLAHPDEALDPRASPLRARELRGLPPAYIATAGFDVLRDEGEEYARRLRAAGTPVTLRRHAGLVHGFAADLGVGHFAERALGEAAGALSDALTR